FKDDFIFFFSSRRRHTRSKRDWSSDVCSSDLAGMNAKRNIILAMLLSGGLAGLGGVMNGLGEFRNVFLTNGVAPAIGFDGLAVALLGGLNPIGIIFASLFFGGLKIGDIYMLIIVCIT